MNNEDKILSILENLQKQISSLDKTTNEKFEAMEKSTNERFDSVAKLLVKENKITRSELKFEM